MKNYQLKKIKGATMIEYVLIAALIGVGAIAILTTLKGSINNLFSKVDSTIKTT